MKIRYIFLPFILTALLITAGCAAKSPIVYSPLKDISHSSPGTNVPEQLDELLKEDKRIYKKLAKQTTVVENAEDEDDEEKNQNPAEAYNETTESHNDMEWFEIGRQSVIAEKWNEALNAFDNAIKLNPKNTEAYFNRGNVYDELGNYKQAVIDYNKVIKLNPIYADAYLRRGLAHNNLGKLNRAIADIKKAARLGNHIAQKFLTKKGLSWQITL